jgi:hypothetical protein
MDTEACIISTALGYLAGKSMRIFTECLFVVSLCVACASAQAQIYSCTAPDGTRVFSDERCGPDAKVVPGIGSKKRPSQSSAPKREPGPKKTSAELEQLIAQCNAGEMKACTEWTHGGGPNHLREQERKAATACEAGSLADCEERYCPDGMTDECRTRVMEAASVSGDAWYLRSQRTLQDGGTAYQVRCATLGLREIKDATVTCAGPPGPKRCFVTHPQQGFARLDQAASNYCTP